MSTTDLPPDGADPAPRADDMPEQLMAAATARIAELEAEAQEFRDKWLRSEAEMANVRTRAKRDADDARQFAVQKFARDVVEAADNLRRGLDQLPAAQPGEPEIVGKLRDGFEGVERSFLSLLERNGIARVDPTGKPFDANLHQAMAEQPIGRAHARHGDPGLDGGLDAQRPAAAPGDGGGGQGGRGRAGASPAGAVMRWTPGVARGGGERGRRSGEKRGLPLASPVGLNTSAKPQFPRVSHGASGRRDR